MSDYRFYSRGKHTLALKRLDVNRALDLTEQGYKKQFEEVRASDETEAQARFADIRRNQRIDQHNFLAGAATMPLIGVLTAVATFLFWRKRAGK
ncbi:hypothetical protein F3I27_15985 [Pantoea sp. Bo_2]|uniref:Uncharacterized protein n=1 Tax=Candidatus Pantoea gossypiicola TaxID=2608008 RepID=A0AB34CPB3_9GAMM|nr:MULTISPECIES: hypothetical protein [Pantoea]KAA5930196.1 hypothetical protein F3I59_08055 [Pantoea sp. VH_8]KAA5936183.1 hypothetical protein F3I58_07870 [Pantoea sp. VH_4]KAA5943901.1 hypothetical protein F3I57_13525 [Pantoea sp. VH_3]KAA5951387.1 hypothetical protein F3I56_14040 [Pantoea sp. VH_25]KAA5952475.1 hypothetical protein F3I55_17405 [Pantoea sp. VH_24]